MLARVLCCKYCAFTTAHTHITGEKSVSFPFLSSKCSGIYHSTQGHIYFPNVIMNMAACSEYF